MSIALAVIAALFSRQIWHSRLIKGEYGLKTTFWGFGLLGGLLGYGLAVWLFADALASGGDPLDGLRLAAIPVGLYSLTVFIGIWRASKSARFIHKLGARYFGATLASTFAAGVLVNWFAYLVFAAVAYFVFKHGSGSAPSAARSTSREAGSA